MKLIEIMSGASPELPYTRGKATDGTPLRHPHGLSYLLVAGQTLSDRTRVRAAAVYPGVERGDVAETELEELNRQPSLVSARIVEVPDFLEVPKDAASPASPSASGLQNAGEIVYDYKALQKLASDNNIKAVGVSTVALIDQLTAAKVDLSSAVKA